MKRIFSLIPAKKKNRQMAYFLILLFVIPFYNPFTYSILMWHSSTWYLRATIWCLKNKAQRRE